MQGDESQVDLEMEDICSTSVEEDCRLSLSGR